MLNALKAHRKGMLARDIKLDIKLVPSKFLLKQREDLPGKVFYVNRVFPHEIYATLEPYFQNDIRDHDIILTDEKKKRYEKNEFYLGHFKVQKD
jgi:hypothetical protein